MVSRLWAMAVSSSSRTSSEDTIVYWAATLGCSSRTAGTHTVANKGSDRGNNDASNRFSDKTHTDRLYNKVIVDIYPIYEKKIL